MDIKRVVPNITTNRLDESRKFYMDLFGFEVAMDMDWIVTLVSPSSPAIQISLVRGEREDTSQHDMTLSIEVDNVDSVHQKAISLGHPILYALTDEPWGVRRFHIEDPNGVILNVMSHIVKGS